MTGTAVLMVAAVVVAVAEVAGTAVAELEVGTWEVLWAGRLAEN